MLFYDELYEDYMKKLADIDKNPKNQELFTFRYQYDLDTTLGGQNRYSVEELNWIIGPDGQIIKFIDKFIPYTHIIYSYDKNESPYCYKYAYCYYDVVVALGTEEGRCGGITTTYLDNDFNKRINKLINGDINEKKLYDKIKRYNICKKKIYIKEGIQIEYKEIKRDKEWIELIINKDPNSNEFNLFVNKNGEYNYVKSGTLEELKNSDEWKI